MDTHVIVWSKPDCVQCKAVYRRLDEAEVPYKSKDLTAPEYSADLEYFKGLGYRTAPITEFNKTLVPGFVPVEIDKIIEEYHAAYPARD